MSERNPLIKQTITAFVPSAVPPAIRQASIAGLCAVDTLPSVYRLTQITHASQKGDKLRYYASLFHQKANLKVSWLTNHPDTRLHPGVLVSPAWCSRRVLTGEGQTIAIDRLILLERPLPQTNLFETVSPEWVKNRGLITDAAELLTSLPQPMRHLFNAVFWEGPRFERYCCGPSSLNHHHAVVNGNLAHSVEVAKIMFAMAGARRGINPALSILLGLLHDAGKADEYQMAASGSWQMSERGKLVGHRQTIIEWLSAAFHANRIGMSEQDRLNLIHCLTASEYAPDWLGLRRPRMAEAILLSSADRCSGRSNRMRKGKGC